MANVGPDLMMPDERAAGVISGSDPYRELELYLEKVNEEFGEVFERWLGSSELNKLKHNIKPPQQGSPRSGVTEKAKSYCNGNSVKRRSKEMKAINVYDAYANSYQTRSLPLKPKNGNGRNCQRLNNIYAYASDKAKVEEKEWSDGLMADFEKLIAMELSQLTIDAIKEKRENQESSGSPHSDSSTSTDSNSSTGSLKRNSKNFKRSFSDGSDVTVQDGRTNGDAVLIRVRPIRDETQRRGSDSQLPPRRPRRMPSPVRIREFFRSTSPFGRKGKREISELKKELEGKESYRNINAEISQLVPSKRKKNNDKKMPVGLQNFLTKIRPTGSRNKSPLRGESPGELTSGFNTMDSSVADAEDSLDAILSSVSTATQTSPPLSRSSSFTWMSDCSSSIILNTPGSLSDVNDEKSSSSGRSSSSPTGLPSENGCGGESDCGTSGSQDSSAESRDSGDITRKETKERQKLTRKETWEKIRRRHSELLRLGRKSYSGDIDVWVKRESVHTQTQDDGVPDHETLFDDLPDNSISKWLENDQFDEMPRGLPPRPKNDPEESGARSLPLEKSRSARPQHLPVPPLTTRSLPSPVECEDQPSFTTSLKLMATPLTSDLVNKSSSAPVIMKQAMAVKKDFLKSETDTKKLVLKQPRSQSERHLTEIEATEACKWLRATGFPQYAQMFEDLQFPIDVSGVQKDHPFLDKDSLQSLFRRLQALNRCAKMKIDNPPKTSMDDSDEDDQCALSENWTFQPESKRWSRVCDVTNHHADRAHNTAVSRNASEGKADSSVDSDRLMSSGEDLICSEDIPIKENLRYGSLPQGAISADSELIAVRFRRTNSERLRNSAKAILRRMESLKSRRRKKQTVENVSISGPRVLDVPTMQQKMKDLNCVDVSPTATSGSSPEYSFPSPFHLPSPSCQYLSPPFADDSSSYCSDNSQGTPAYQRTKSKLHRAKKFFHHSRKNDESGALSDSEIQPTSWKHRYVKDANSNHAKVLEYIDGRPRGPQDQEPPGPSGVPTRGGSLNLGKESQRYREQVQASFRRKGAKMYLNKSGSSELTEDSNSTFASHADSDQEPIDITTRQRVTVVRWHSFQRGSLRPDSYYLNADSNIPFEYRSINALSCGQLLVLKKMALLKLTACMEKYCPTHRTGWNWELPKFIRKIKTPDYKDKTVFGVPLLLSLQRSGQALPKCIQIALRWLRINALDQVGIFRKSGVRSRIQTLKAMTENQGELISYDGHQAYDVADMVKQYFRELPEALLTNKLSETFVSIFQHVPESFRGDAVQWALLLLPDEHREALQTVLEFLNQVSARSTCNQMNASNLAVCLAPSLFHLHHPSPGSQSRSTSASPRRRKTVGVPDQRELGENRAAQDCLLYLMKENKDIFTINEEMFASCRFSTMDYSLPMTIEQLGSELPDGWRGYLRESISSFLREAKEKSRGWVSVPCSLDNNTEMAYKKVGDGHPLRLWKVWTEVEAPPQELVRRVLRERHLWDMSLLKWRVVARLDAQAEIFQFVCGSMPPLPAKDFCVLRSWKTDLAKGACVIVETSVEHPDASVLLGGVRGVVLASRYLIEPCGSGKSRIVHLSRVDTKGRSPEWYNKSYGHICAMQLSRIRTSFKHNTVGPESKV